MRRSPSALFFVALLALFTARQAAAAHHGADLVVTDARIYTADGKHSIATAMAIRGERIVFVGSSEAVRKWIGPNTRVERLAGKLMLPGLFDSHLHPIGVVEMEACDLRNEGKSLAQITEFVRGCIERFQVPEGAWVSVRQWNPSADNSPDALHPTLRAALDLASTRHPIQLLGNDGHHSAFNSAALAHATNASGQVVGYSKATLAGDLAVHRRLVGVDIAGEPNGTVNEDARRPMSPPAVRAQDRAELTTDPGRMTARLNSVGITGFMDAAVPQEALAFYDALEHSGKLTARVALAQYFDPDLELTTDGKPDWNRMVALATAARAKYSHNPLIRADIVKLFADGVLEGNPLATPPTLPEAAAIRPYLQPIFGAGADGRPAVTGYVDTGSPVCSDVRANPTRYESAAAIAEFMKRHGHHPGQCEISSGQLQHDRGVIMEYVRRFHVAGFNVHIHAIGDLPIRTAVDAIEAARAFDGISSQHDALAHIQLVHPDDLARIGRDHLYLAFTYSWILTDPEYDLSVVPFLDHVSGVGAAALHPANGYYEKNAYPVRSLRDAGAILMAGSDAPVESRDPRPFMNMAMAVTRRLPGRPSLNAAESIPLRDAIDAYTIHGARYLNRDQETGSLEVGKSADFILLDRDILRLDREGRADEIAKTQVLKTFFMGREVYSRP